jgi:hypothetical protein
MQRDKDRRGFSHSAGFRCFFLLLLTLTYLSGCGNGDLSFTSEYQAVFLDNGQVFFGKLSDPSSPFLTLRDVYYVQTLVEREKKETANILVKRGSEWHNPDFMRINPGHVVVIEPVGPDSRVAQLIREARVAPVTQTAPTPKSESSAPAPTPAPKSPPAGSKTPR